jgi:hypothetical protein
VIVYNVAMDVNTHNRSLQRTKHRVCAVGVRLCALSREELEKTIDDQKSTSDDDKNNDRRDLRGEQADNMIAMASNDAQARRVAARNAACSLLDDAADDEKLFVDNSAPAQVSLQTQRCVAAASCAKLFEVRILALDAFSSSMLFAYFDKSDVDKVRVCIERASVVHLTHCAA